MKILLVPWMLLLLGVRLNSGHYIRIIEDGKKEGSSGMAFENPKPDNPTLREILYYHIIERPREEPVMTARSFTNSHGYQFSEEPLSEEHYEQERAEHDDNDIEHAEDSQEYIGKEDTEMDEEEPETPTEVKPLTDEDVKEAYKSRSYLFDQVRQRYAVKGMAVPDSLKRMRRQAEMQLPEAPSLSNKDAYVSPNTYGMNLNPGGGYVWNNLNKPIYYEHEPSNGNSNEGQYASGQSQENMPLPSENIRPSQTSDAGSSEDIYVNTNRPSAMPLETEPENTYPEFVNDNPQRMIDNSEPNNENPESDSVMKPVEPILGNDGADSNDGFANNPIGPEVYENPEPNSSVESIANTQEAEAPQADTPISEGPAETVGESNENPRSIYNGLLQPAESNDNPGYDNGQSQAEGTNENPGYRQSELEQNNPESSPEESSEVEKIREIPEAPTLPPLNLDNLPDYIRDAISSTEKPKSNEQTDNPYINPQPSPDDNEVLNDKMEDIFATMQPVEDIPKTYGMNLTSDGGHVWNDMVNPPVSYDVGSPHNPKEENKEEQTQAPTEQPEIHEPENPIPKPAEPEIDQHITNPEEPNQEPGTQESEEDKPPGIDQHINNPAEFDQDPGTHESEEDKPPGIEQLITNPEEPNQEPGTHESEEDKPPGIDQHITNPEEPNQEPGTHESEEDKPPGIDQHITNPEEPNQEPGTHESEEDKPPGIDQHITNPEDPNQEPGTHESEEDKAPGIDQHITNPEEPNQEPGTHESEEDKPIEEPISSQPENEGKPEEPIGDSNQGLPEKDNEPDPPIQGNEENPIEEPTQPEPVEPKPNVEPENPEFIPEPGNEGNYGIEVQEQPGTEEPSEESTEHIEEPENVPVGKKTEEENNKSDIMYELLKSEQFWKWLGEWTATYMELLEKHMRKIAIQEICKREKAGEQMCLLEDNPEDTDVIVKDGKIIVDGKEIEMTHTDNLDGELKRYHNNKHENKGTNGNKVEASTIYGNSVGNDKVTNVFIFTADKAEEVIDQLIPVNDTEVNFVIDDRIKEENKDELNKEMSIEDEGNVGTSNIDTNNESNEGGMEESNKSESHEEKAPNDGNKEPSEGSILSQANTELHNNESKDDVSEEQSNKNEDYTAIKPEVDADLRKDVEPAEVTEVNKDRENEEPNGTSGDIAEIDDEANDEPKIDSSENDLSNSQEYLEK